VHDCGRQGVLDTDKLRRPVARSSRVATRAGCRMSRNLLRIAGAIWEADWHMAVVCADRHIACLRAGIWSKRLGKSSRRLVESSYRAEPRHAILRVARDLSAGRSRAGGRLLSNPRNVGFDIQRTFVHSIGIRASWSSSSASRRDWREWSISDFTAAQAPGSAPLFRERETCLGNAQAGYFRLLAALASACSFSRSRAPFRMFFSA